MSRQGFAGHSRWDDHLGPGTELDDEDLLEDEPPEHHYRRQAARIRQQLDSAPPTDPALVARLKRDLAAWERLAAAGTVEAHWSSGEGDRKLF